VRKDGFFTGIKEQESEYGGRACEILIGGSRRVRALSLCEGSYMRETGRREE
jgi:hypothetical protein